MPNRILKALLLAPVLLLLMAAAPVLVDPEPILVPAGVSEQAVSKAVRVGVVQRGWVLTRQDPGYVEATLHLRTHVAKIGITYDTHAVTIRYLDSENLDYSLKNDVARIHGNYMKWVTNVARDISVQLHTAPADAGE